MHLINIGKWKVFPIETGLFSLDGGAMMGTVPKVLWEKTNPSDKYNRIDLALRCLFADDGKHKILIETGIGDKNPENFIEMFNIRKNKLSFEKELNKVGYKPEDITHVFLTHLHFDHAGGATICNDSNSVVPYFSNAKYYVSKENWEAGLNPSERDKASYLKENYIPLKEAGVLNIMNENDKIIEGLETYIVNGHTTGQQLIKLVSGGDTLVFCSDLIPLKSHLKLPWIMGYDLNAALTLKEKKIFLNEAVKNNWLLFFYHDPITIAARIEIGQKYYKISEEYERKNSY